jgi:hypothetical protein
MKRLALLLALAGLGALGCGNSQQATIGPSQPFRVRGAQFISGAFPGEPPPDAGSTAAEDGQPLVTAADLNSSVAIQGQGGKAVSGRATASSHAVGIALDELGGGYWVVPTRLLDLVTGDVTWSATLDFDRSIAPGLHPLRFVAFDENGNPGAQIAVKFCITGLVPDNLSACEPSIAPPAAVISLSWDTNVDLDLQVVTPEGVVVTPKHPSTVPPMGDAGADAAAPSGALGTIDRDSNANCAVDGVRTAPGLSDGVRAHALTLIHRGGVSFRPPAGTSPHELAVLARTLGDAIATAARTPLFAATGLVTVGLLVSFLIPPVVLPAGAGADELVKEEQEAELMAEAVALH